MIHGRNVFVQPIKNDVIIYENIKKIATNQGDGYTTGSLLNHPYFDKVYKIIGKDLSKQQTLDGDPKAIQQIMFVGNLKTGYITLFFIMEEAGTATTTTTKNYK